MPMSQEKIKKIHLIYGCIAAVLIVALGIALILSCLNIYNSGPRPYTPESIGTHFQRIAVLAYVCIAVALGGIILNLALPTEKQKPKANRDVLEAMNRLKTKAPELSEQSAQAARKEQHNRLLYRLGTALIFAALMVYPAIYFMDGSHFTITSLNEDIRNAVCIALIPAFAGLMLCFVCSLLEIRSISRETDIYKKAIADAKGTATPSHENTTSHKLNTILITRCVLLGVAVCFIVLGILNGGMKDVLDKAVAICTECIGLG